MTPAAVIAAIQAASMSKVGTKTSLTGEVVTIAPSLLADSAQLPLDVYSVARLVASEWGSGPAPGLLAIAEAARNRAKALGQTMTAMLTKDTNAAQTGYYGRQTGRWAATSQDPTARAVAAARGALEAGTNVASGAVKFFHPRTQDRGWQGGTALTKDAAQVVTSWAGDGYQFIHDAPLYSMGIDPYEFMIFKRVSGKVDTARALTAISKGRGSAGGATLSVMLLLAIVAGWYLLKGR